MARNKLNTNAQRADSGRNAVVSNGMGDTQNAEENLIDLLTNLRHFANEEQINFDRAVITAGFHYREETT